MKIIVTGEGHKTFTLYMAYLDKKVGSPYTQVRAASTSPFHIVLHEFKLKSPSFSKF